MSATGRHGGPRLRRGALRPPSPRDLRLPARMLRDPELAADLTQDAFVKAYRAYETLEDPAHARAWLYQIAHRVALDDLRRRKIIRFLPWTGESRGSVALGRAPRHGDAPVRRPAARTRPDPGATTRRAPPRRGPRPHRPRARRCARRQPRRGARPADPGPREPPPGARRRTPGDDRRRGRARQRAACSPRAGSPWPAAERVVERAVPSVARTRERWASDHERARQRAAERLSLPLPAAENGLARPTSPHVPALCEHRRRLRGPAIGPARPRGAHPATRPVGPNGNGTRSGRAPGAPDLPNASVFPGRGGLPGSRGSRSIRGLRAEQRASAFRTSPTAIPPRLMGIAAANAGAAAAWAGSRRSARSRPSRS